MFSGPEPDPVSHLPCLLGLRLRCDFKSASKKVYSQIHGLHIEKENERERELILFYRVEVLRLALCGCGRPSWEKVGASMNYFGN